MSLKSVVESRVELMLTLVREAGCGEHSVLDQLTQHLLVLKGAAEATDDEPDKKLTLADLTSTKELDQMAREAREAAQRSLRAAGVLEKVTPVKLACEGGPYDRVYVDAPPGGKDGSVLVLPGKGGSEKYRLTARGGTRVLVWCGAEVAT